jgi:hypothetical protein
MDMTWEAASQVGRKWFDSWLLVGNKRKIFYSPSLTNEYKMIPFAVP